MAQHWSILAQEDISANDRQVFSAVSQENSSTIIVCTLTTTVRTLNIPRQLRVQFTHPRHPHEQRHLSFHLKTKPLPFATTLRGSIDCRRTRASKAALRDALAIASVETSQVVVDDRRWYGGRGNRKLGSDF
jgi:hypothetical protein